MITEVTVTSMYDCLVWVRMVNATYVGRMRSSTHYGYEWTTPEHNRFATFEILEDGVPLTLSADHVVAIRLAKETDGP